jgi:hypothetical protein
MPDRAARPESPAIELEVTPEMIEAGVAVLYASGAIESPLREADRQLVAAVFRRMAGLWLPSG